MFRDAFQNVVDIHTSGHADRKTIKQVIDTVNPKEAIIGIHKDKGQTLNSLDVSEDIKNKIINN
jgi:ribonuclease J